MHQNIFWKNFRDKVTKNLGFWYIRGIIEGYKLNWNRTLELHVNSHERKNMLHIYILTGRDFILVRKSTIVMTAVIHQYDNCRQNFKKKQHLTRCMLHCAKNVVFTCDSCQKTFRGKDSLKRHALICGGKNEKHCHEFKKDFCSPYYLKRHLEEVPVEKKHLYLWEV